MMLIDSDDRTDTSNPMIAGRTTSPAPRNTLGSIPGSLGFPTGYFVIRNLATGRLWDVSGNLKEDGTKVHLFREKEASLVENLRDPWADNQVFFIDYTGALCSKPTGNAIDVEDGRLVLRHRRPMTLPFPNAYSHPIPRFVYDPSTGHLLLRYACDPSYPPAGASPSLAWREREYLVTSIPLRKPRNLIDNATLFFSSTASKIITGKDSSAGDFDLTEDEVLEEERGEDGEVDDSPENRRDMQVISLPLSHKEFSSQGGNAKARERRRWEIVPLLREKARYDSGRS